MNGRKGRREGWVDELKEERKEIKMVERKVGSKKEK